MPATVAAVDVGSTSVHLLVAGVVGHDIEPLADDSVFLGLGARIHSDGHLGADARARLVDALVTDADRARALGATAVTFVGTEPMRRAADAARVVLEVAQASAIPLHVLSHQEEAHLTLIGVMAGRPLGGPLAVVDIGGGSTEIVIAAPFDGVEVQALQVGAGRLATETLHGDPPERSEVAALRAAARRWIDSIPKLAHPRLVAVGGTASNLLKILPSIPPDRALTRERLSAAIDALVAAPASDVAARHGIGVERARILPAGAALLEAVLDRAAADEIVVSEAGVREGTVLVTAHVGVAWRDRLPELVAGWSD